MATVSIANDYLAWDNVETLHLTVNKDGKQQKRETTDYGLEINPTDRRSSYQNVRTNARQTTFWLPVAEIGSVEIDGNAVILRDSDDTKFSVNDSKLIKLGTSKSHWDVLVTRHQSEP